MEKPKATLASSDIKGEIAQIEQQLAQKRAELLQMQKAGEIQEIPHEKETLREIMTEKITPSSQLQTSGSLTNDDTDNDQKTTPPDKDTPSYLRPEFHESVQQLVNTAFNSSIDDAVKKVKSTNDPALIDAFHDAMVDELYDHLVERGKLKKL